MATFLVEAYEPRTLSGSLPELEARARAAADSVSSEGVSVRYVRSTFVPEDEICFFVFEAPSAETVGVVAERALLRFERIVEALEPRDV